MGLSQAANRTTLWRISNHESLSGEGGLRTAARWNTAGRPIVYLAESVPGAMIEVLVHLELKLAEVPRSYKLLEISIPGDVPVDTLQPPDAWQDSAGVSRSLGDAWLSDRKTALARVPSAILPRTWNYVLNPAHPESSKVKIVGVTIARYDPRLFP